jgi:tetratricopeptide (TPR) repeat protein
LACTGILNAKCGLLKEAVSDYDRAITLDAGNAEAYFCRGNAHLALGDLEAAVADFDSAIARDPSYVDAMSNRGVAFERMESWSKALQSYKDVLAIDPHRVVPRMNMGNVLAVMGNHAGAVAAYTDAINRAPRAGAIYILRAKARLAQGQFAASLQDLSDARSFGCADAEVAFLEGQAYHALRQPDKAVNALRQAIELDNRNAFAFGMLGWNEFKLGLIADAAKHIRLCLRIDPNNEAAQNTLKIISAMGVDLPEVDEAAELQDTSVKEVETSTPLSVGPKTADAYIVERDWVEDVPWSTFDGWLKSMRPGDFDEEQRRAFELTFAHFFEEQQTAPSVIEESQRSLGGLAVTFEQPFAFRRFAGGRNLPRSRYYSVCQDSTGDDGGTLRNELCSYVDVRVSGEISVWDYTDPMLLGAKLANRNRFTRDEFPEYPLGVNFQSARGVESPWADQLKDTKRAHSGARIHLGEGFTIFLPLRVERVTVQRVIDLRTPSVRQWLAQHVFSGIPTARYIYSDIISPPTDRGELFRHLLTISIPQLLLDESEIAKHLADSAKGDARKIQAEGHWEDMKFYATHPEGKCNRLSEMTDNAFHNLLPLLLFHPKGGSPITEAIGEWLRSLGANAFIYPSARNDTRVQIENGTLTRFAGWNLLDYRDAPPAPKLLRLVQNPTSYISLGTQLSRGLPREARLAGSFSISGILDREQQEWVFKQEMYYQVKMFADTPALFLKEFDSADLTSKISLAEVRALVRAKSLDYRFECVKGAASASRPIGQWLAEYLEIRVPDKTFTEVGSSMDKSGFFYRLDSTLEPQIICPICEYNRIWSLDRNELVDRACPVCGYKGRQEIDPKVTAARFFDLCDKL